MDGCRENQRTLLQGLGTPTGVVGGSLGATKTSPASTASSPSHPLVVLTPSTSPAHGSSSRVVGSNLFFDLHYTPSSPGGTKPACKNRPADTKVCALLLPLGRDTNAMARLTRTPLCCAALRSFARGRNRQEGGDYEADDKEVAMGLTKRKSAPSSSLMIEPNPARKLGRPPKRRKTEGAARLSMFGASLSLSVLVSCTHSSPSSEHTPAVEWVGRAKMDEASGRKLYRGFVLGGCKYETGDCVYLNAPKNESDEGTALPFPFPFACWRAHVGGLGGNAWTRRAFGGPVLHRPDHGALGNEGRQVHALGPLVLPTTRDRRLSGTLPPQGLDLADREVSGLGLALTSYIVFVIRVATSAAVPDGVRGERGGGAHRRDRSRDLHLRGLRRQPRALRRREVLCAARQGDR